MNLLNFIAAVGLGFILGRKSHTQKRKKEKCRIASKIEENREYLNFLNYCGEEQE